MSESQSVPDVEEDSFATIIIFAHGADVRSHRASLEQHDTLRKFTLAGKSGHLSYAVQDVMDSMFYLAHQLARLEHVPFTEKLKFMRTESKRQKFGKILQDMYYEDPLKFEYWKSLVPTADDWLSTTNVSYDHEYHFVVDNPADPWEIDQLGIWLVDGSPRVLQGFKDVPIPPDSLRYYNIMDRIGLPQWPDVKGTITTLFDVAHRIKTTFRVKYVNFIDTSCRFVHHPITATDDVPSAGMSEIAPSASHQPDIVQIGDIRIEKMSKQPPNLPAGWVFGKNRMNGEYVFANPDSGAISTNFPEADSGAISPADICVATLDKSNGGHKESVSSVAFNSTMLLATGSSDNTAKLWRLSPDISSWTCAATLWGHSKGVTSVAFDSSGTILATGSLDKTAKVWQLSSDGSSGTCVATLDKSNGGHTGIITSVAFHPTGTLLATGSLDKTAKLWRLSPDNSSGTCVDTLTGHSDSVLSVAFHPTAPILATGGGDKTAKLWQLLPEAEGGSSCVATLDKSNGGHSGDVNSVAFDSSGTLLATGSSDWTVKLWKPDGSSWTCVATLKETSPVYSVAFDSSGTMLATGSFKTVKVWRLSSDGTSDGTTSATCVAILGGHTASVHSVAFDSSGTMLATGSGDGTAKLWNFIELCNKIKQENHAPGAPAYMVRCDKNKIDPPKIFGMPQTLPQGWSYVRGEVPFKGHTNSALYGEYYIDANGTMNPYFPGPYRQKKNTGGSKQNKKRTKKYSKQNKNKTRKTKSK